MRGQANQRRSCAVDGRWLVSLRRIRLGCVGLRRKKRKQAGRRDSPSQGQEDGLECALARPVGKDGQSTVIDVAI